MIITQEDRQEWLDEGLLQLSHVERTVITNLYMAKPKAPIRTLKAEFPSLTSKDIDAIRLSALEKLRNRLKLQDICNSCDFFNEMQGSAQLL